MAHTGSTPKPALPLALERHKCWQHSTMDAPRLFLMFNPEVPVAFKHATAMDIFLLVAEAGADIHLLDLALDRE